MTRLTVEDPYRLGEDHFVIDGPYTGESHCEAGGIAGVIVFKPLEMSRGEVAAVLRQALAHQAGPRRLSLEVRDLVDVGTSCPSQWEATTTGGDGVYPSGRHVYIRFRFGQLTVTVTVDADSLGRGVQVYSEGVGRDEMDGVMDTHTMLDHTGIQVVR